MLISSMDAVQVFLPGRVVETELANGVAFIRNVAGQIGAA